VVKVPVKCIHCRSENVVKMGQQPTNKTPDVNVTHAAKPSKPHTKIVEPHPKPNNK